MRGREVPSLDRQQLTFHPILQPASPSGQDISLDRVFSPPSVFEHTVAVVSNLLLLQTVRDGIFGESRSEGYSPGSGISGSES